jgi:hypothetical protein
LLSQSWPNLHRREMGWGCYGSTDGFDNSGVETRATRGICTESLGVIDSCRGRRV